jgi:hypothetical protein
MTDKITLNDVTSFQNDTTAVITVNNNSNTIETAFNNTLSRDGTSPNQMEAVLDMNSNAIINLPAPISLSSPLRLEDAATLNGGGTIEVGGVPNGGTTGQVLTKHSDADQDIDWETPEYLTSGGTAGQVLTKNSATNFDASWQTPASSSNPIPGTIQIIDAAANIPSTTISNTVDTLLVLGYKTTGDMSMFNCTRQSSQPRYGGFQSADGAWWMYIPGPAGVDARAFGVVADWNQVDATATDCTVPLQNAINYAAQFFYPNDDTGGGTGTDVLLPKGAMLISQPMVVYDGVRLLGKGAHDTILVMSQNFSTSATFFTLGTPTDTASVAQAQHLSTAGNFNLNGTWAWNGGVTFLNGVNPITFYSSGNDSGITFTVHGLDNRGNTVSETLTGSNASAAVTTHSYSVVTSVSASGATAGTVSIGQPAYAAFNCRLECLQLFSTNVNATNNSCMVYTNNAQHWGGIKSIKILGAGRVCAFFQTGIGGASYFTFEDVECFNSCQGPGVASNNPRIILDWGGLLCSLNNIVVEGPNATIAGSQSVGILITGGFVNLSNCHIEGVATGIALQIPNVNAGALNLTGLIGGALTTTLVQMQANPAIAGTCTCTHVFADGAAVTVQDTNGAGHTGNIYQPTTF